MKGARIKGARKKGAMKKGDRKKGAKYSKGAIKKYILLDWSNI